MTPPPDQDPSAAGGQADASDRVRTPADGMSVEPSLARVQGKVDAARAVLLRLLQEVVVAEARLSNDQATRMRAANAQLVVSALRDQAEAQLAMQSLSDMTRAAGLDPLTGLPNRALMLDRLTQALAAARRHATRLALLFVDLDQFKQINDSFGHAIGDQALLQVAQRLSQAVREVDTVSRHGGDEFLILLAEVTQAADAGRLAAKLLAELGQPLDLGGQSLQLSASIGISLYPDDGESITDLIAHADKAMYQAKQKGPGQFAQFGDPPAGPAQPPAAPNAHAQALAAHERRHALLQQANEQLVLAALGAQEMQAAAERALQQQADFMAAVVEELSNPFAPIRLASAMVGLPQGDATLLPRVQALVEQQAAGMARLVQAAHARTAGQAEPAGAQACDLAAVVDSVLADARPLMDLRQQRLTLALPAGPVALRGDAGRLTHLLGNLLDNASKYTHEGGAIRLDAAVQGLNIVFTVTDDGIGIQPESLPLMFEAFGQDSQGIGLNGASTGIGLPVVRALATALGGTVEADSAGKGRGSRFVVTLPLAGAPDTPRAGA